MSELRDQIAAVLKSRWPAPWFGGDRQHQQVADLADAVIRELGLHLADEECRMCSHLADAIGQHRYITEWIPNE
jgi:hypothetical protein